MSYTKVNNAILSLVLLNYIQYMYENSPNKVKIGCGKHEDFDIKYLYWRPMWLRDRQSSRERSLIMSFCLLVFRSVVPDRFMKHCCRHDSLCEGKKWVSDSVKLGKFYAKKLKKPCWRVTLFMYFPTDISGIFIGLDSFTSGIQPIKSFERKEKRLLLKDIAGSLSC